VDAVGRAVSRTAVQSGTLAGCVNQYPDLDLNQGLDLRRVQCVPLHHRDMQSQSARARGVEPREAVLEAAGSPRSTLVYTAHPTLGSQGIRRELNPYLLVHSQACSDRYTTDTMSISSPTRI